MHPTGCQGAISCSPSTAGHAHVAVPQLDISQLEENVSYYLGQALVPSILWSYRSGQKQFLQFCHDSALQPWPLTEHLFCLFVGKENLCHQTIKCYLSTLRFLSITTGRGDPFGPGAFPVLQYVLRGVKWVPRPPAHTRLPVTPAILRTLKSWWAPHVCEIDYVMLWAACCVGFFGFLRAGEFTVRSADKFNPLMLEDVAHDNPALVRIRAKQTHLGMGLTFFLGGHKQMCVLFLPCYPTLQLVHQCMAPCLCLEMGLFCQETSWYQQCEQHWSRLGWMQKATGAIALELVLLPQQPKLVWRTPL